MQNAERVARASTFMQNSMIFKNNKIKKRDSKNIPVKSSIIMDKKKNGFADRRTSKTFVESDML